jgi:hypothetical protein
MAAVSPFKTFDVGLKTGAYQPIAVLRQRSNMWQ